MKNLDERKKRAVVVVRELKKLFLEMKTMLHYSTPWELLVAVILSAQTTDKQVNVVTEKLFQTYPTFDDYVGADLQAFQKNISSVNYYNNKGKHILAAARIIQDEFEGEVPRTLAKMVTLPGVGRKTANVVLGNVYGVVEGIAVDTHVKRLARLFGLTNHVDPVKIEKDLMEIIPKEEWFPFTYRMISYGREFSPARKKDHGDDRILKSLGE